MERRGVRGGQPLIERLVIEIARPAPPSFELSYRARRDWPSPMVVSVIEDASDGDPSPLVLKGNFTTKFDQAPARGAPPWEKMRRPPPPIFMGATKEAHEGLPGAPRFSLRPSIRAWRDRH